MLRRLKHPSNGPMLVLSSLALAILLVACGGGGSTNNTSSTPTVVVTPTSANATPGTMSAYQGGSFFVISYPKNWQITTRHNNIWTFSDSTNAIQLTINVTSYTSNPPNTNSIAKGALQTASATLKNTKTVSVPSTTTFAGESWSQVSASGTESLNNQDTTIQVIVLGTIHHQENPLPGRSFTILYQAPVSKFSQYNTSYFQPMLHSFKFTKAPGTGT